MNNIKLMPLQNAHCEAVEKIARESLPEHWSLESIRDVLRYENNIFYVAYSTEDDQIIGFAGIMVIVDEAELLNIAIHPDFRRMGIGKVLMEQMIREAVKHGASRMLLEVRRSNSAARSLYSRFRFVEFFERKNYYKNPVEDAIIMERKISEAAPLIAGE